MRAIIDQALVDQYIKENPLNSIIVDKLLNKETQKSDYKPDPFSIDEINAILNTSEGQVRLLFQFAFFTGLRISELIGLRWKDIDWQNRLINVEETVVAKESKGPKTEAGVRDVLILPPALEALEQQKQYTFSLKGRVFHNPQTNKPWETYQTRHTYASMMLSQGENIMWVSKQMGHVDVEIVIKTYGRWIPDQSAQSGYRPVHN